MPCSPERPDAADQSDRAGEAAIELLRAEEVRGVLADFAAQGIFPILIKGTPLAYTIYDAPSSRPRADTDLLIPAAQIAAARSTLEARGYQSTVYCDEIFSQFEMQKTDAFGVTHVFDVHWSISTQPIFADCLTYGELAASADAVPLLGPHARAAGRLQALLLACVHPVMHHQNVRRPVWIDDIHLLASRLSSDELDRFVEMAIQKKVATVCAASLRGARERVQTVLPDDLFRRLASAGDEPSAAYLADGRRWHDELASTVAHLPRWSDRLRHLRGVLFPGPRYVLGAYGLDRHPLGTLLLPALYVHRNVRGVWKILSGRK